MDLSVSFFSSVSLCFIHFELVNRYIHIPFLNWKIPLVLKCTFIVIQRLFPIAVSSFPSFPMRAEFFRVILRQDQLPSLPIHSYRSHNRDVCRSLVPHFLCFWHLRSPKMLSSAFKDVTFCRHILMFLVGGVLEFSIHNIADTRTFFYIYLFKIKCG